jgi:hypothetical protein
VIRFGKRADKSRCVNEIARQSRVDHPLLWEGDPHLSSLLEIPP